MRNYLPRPLRGVIVLLPFLALGALADDTLTLENAGAYYAMGGVYTSPYGISVNGGSPIDLICDDFTTDIYVGQSWFAIPTTFAQLEAGTNPTGTPKFAPGGLDPAVTTPAVEIQDYATVAVLAAELMAQPSFGTEPAGEISFALWDVFDGTLLNSTTSDPYGPLTSTELSAAQGYLAGAQALVAGATSGGIVNLSQITVDGSSIAGMTIYTPNPLSASQEFVTVSMPEAPSLAVFAVYFLLGGGALLFFARRRTLRTSLLRIRS